MHTLRYSEPSTLQQATADPCLHERLLDAHRQLWVSLLWGPCSFLLHPGAQVFFVPSKSLFLQSCVSTGSFVMGLMVTSSKRAYATPRVPASAAGHYRLISLQETLKYSKAGLSQSLWGFLVSTKFCLSPPSVSGRYGV